MNACDWFTLTNSILFGGAMLLTLAVGVVVGYMAGSAAGRGEAIAEAGAVVGKVEAFGSHTHPTNEMYEAGWSAACHAITRHLSKMMP